MVLVQDSDEPSVVDCMSRRRCQQAIVRGCINQLRSLLVEDDHDKLISCKAYMDNLVVAQDKENLIQGELRELSIRYNLDARDLEDWEYDLCKDVQKVQVDAASWMSGVKATKSRADKDLREPDVDQASGGLGAGYPSSRNYEEIAEDRARLLAEQNSRMQILEAQLMAMQSGVSELNAARDEISTLKSTLVKQQDSNDSQKMFYEQTIGKLKRESRVEEEDGVRSPRSSSPNRKSWSDRRTGEFGDYSRVGINQEDLLALSHVVGQSNAEMMKSLIDDNSKQRERFYTTLQSPKVELKKFEGEIIKYQSFINRYDDVMGNTGATYSVKLNTLLQSCSDSVLKHLSSCDYQLPQDGYRTARKILKEKYGRPHLVVNAWIERLMDYGKLKPVDVMQQFASDLKACKLTLISMNCIGELDNTDKKKTIVSKLPTYLQNKWRRVVRKANEEGRSASLDQLIDLVSEAAEEQADPVYGPDSLARIAGLYEGRAKAVVKRKMFAMDGVEAVQNRNSQSEARQGSFTPASKESYREKCVCCGGDHFTRKCDAFKAMDSFTKLALAKEKHMCLLCLSTKHAVDQCVFTWRCQKTPCTGKHNNVFHEAITKNEGKVQSQTSRSAQMKNDEDDDEDTDEDQDSKFATPSMSAGCRRYAMPMTPVFVRGNNGLLSTHAFHDSGGGFSIITRKAQLKAGIPVLKRIHFDACTLFAEKSMDVDVVTFLIRGKGCTEDHLVFNAVVMDQEILDERYAKALKEMSDWPHLRDLNMPLHNNNEIDILIGQDNAHIMARKEQVDGNGPYSPYAIRTPVGWTVHGYTLDKDKFTLFESNNFVPVCRDTQVVDDVKPKSSDELLLSAVERLVEIEKVPEKEILSPENQEIIGLWERETKLVDSHVQVPIPVRGGKLDLPNNITGVLKRHEALGRRLRKNDKLCEMYMKSMDENFRAGYSEDVEGPAKPVSEWYIPTQAVVSDKKPNKCRIVGDASYEYLGACLNEAVCQGPNYTAHILDILLKFRRFRYVVTGDIKAMYNQVKVPEEQRDCLRFLHWAGNDPSGKITVHQMTTHMFGGRWSGAVAIFAMRWIARFFQSEYHRETIETILRHFYVDDLLRSFLDEQIGARTIRESRELLGRGSFDLTKINSNSEIIMNEVPVENRSQTPDVMNLDMEGETPEQTLGCTWSRKEDVLGFRSVKKPVIYTRRGVLSSMSSLFDPMGLVAPFVLVARLLLQDIVRLGYVWDEPLTDDLRLRWDVWLKDLESISEYKIPRWLGITDIEGLTYQVHTFMDASERGYGCASYLCSLDREGGVLDVRLIAAKAKVTPVKVITIPRLELCAAVIAVKMDRVIAEYLDMPLAASVFWSDSTIVLYYVNGRPWQYKTFVANRVVYLQEHTTSSQWRHVDTERNIADIASRGVSAEFLRGSEEWLNGPSFLRDQAEWPLPFHQVDDPEVEKELEMKKLSRVNYKIVHSVNKVGTGLCEMVLTHYSRWQRLVRAICYMRRVMEYLKGGRKVYDDGPLKVDEIEKSEMKILRLVQDIYITDTQRRSRMFGKLFPFVQGQLMRVGGRLTNASLSFEEKHPIVFPICHAQEMYVYYVHERVGHGGIDRTFYEARKRFWLLGGKKSVKKVVDRCVICQKTRGKFQRQIMAPLPVFRVEEGKVPFQNVGVDFFGPYYVKHGRGLIKRYACIYTDLLMRASHIEVVPDLTSSAFINSLQRFVSRRGKPALLVSDNGTNFVGANRELREAVEGWNKKSMGKFMAEEGIRWIFNTPTASHHGGVWERMIRVFRNLAVVVMKHVEMVRSKSKGIRSLGCLRKYMYRYRFTMPRKLALFDILVASVLSFNCEVWVFYQAKAKRNYISLI